MPTFCSPDIASLASGPRGWPVLEVPWGSGVSRWQLWPATWWHVESILADPFGGSGRKSLQGLSDAYAEVRQLAERPALGESDAWEPCGLVPRGWRPAEAFHLASHFGPGWRLPTDSEWVSVYRWVEAGGAVVDLQALAEWCESQSNAYAKLVCRRLLTQWRDRTTLIDLMMLGTHMVEWVICTGGEFGGRGRCSTPFIASPLDPYPLRPLGVHNQADRLPLFALRAVQFVATS